MTRLVPLSSASIPPRFGRRLDATERCQVEALASARGLLDNAGADDGIDPAASSRLELWPGRGKYSPAQTQEASMTMLHRAAEWLHDSSRTNPFLAALVLDNPDEAEAEAQFHNLEREGRSGVAERFADLDRQASKDWANLRRTVHLMRDATRNVQLVRLEKVAQQPPATSFPTQTASPGILGRLIRWVENY